jgi:kynurenine 3-monooxygenase
MRARTAAHTGARVVIVGGGLVGCVLAMFLVRRGLRVTIYERRRDSRRETHSRRPSLSLSLCTRGIRSLQRIGVMADVERALAPAYGRMIHAADGTANYQPYSVFGEAISCVSRQSLGFALLTAAEAQGVEIHFERRLVAVDARLGWITVEDLAGVRTHDVAPAIFAADGSHSTVREHLEDEQWWRSSHVTAPDAYKEFRIGAVDLRHDVIHGWPRAQLIAGAFPEPDGTFSGTLHMPATGPVSLAALNDRSVATAVFERECPELLAAVPDLPEQLREQRPNVASTVLCRPWSANGRVLLIGDAAHAMLPYYGQGANAGFEDCAILDDLVERHGADWPRVFREFESIRKPDTDAMAGLCEAHLTVLRGDVSRPNYQAQWDFEQRLHRLIPDVFTPLYSMIAFSSVPYARAQQWGHVQEALVRALLSDADVTRGIADAELARRARRYLAAASGFVRTGA